jgi:uncharacterized NAD(P)/FAD-binding protein YdhS
MWWNGQNLEKPVTDKKGHVWHFRVWHDHLDGIYMQRIFFWNEERTETGLLELRGDRALHITRIKQRIARIVHDRAYRQQFHCTLAFPVERHYG